MTNFGHGLQADMDSWNEVVASWMSSILWAPHHVVALIACLTGFLLLWCIEHGSNARTHIVLAACAFASAAGSSIYVTLVFAAFLAVWTAIMLVRRYHRDCVVLLSTGALGRHPFSAVPAQPHVAWRRYRRRLPEKRLLTFSVRKFTLAETLLSGSIPNGGWLIQLVYAALLPLNYFLELGFFFAIGWLTLKKYRKSGQLTRQQLALSTMLITTVVVCTFVRSSVIANNDLGWRGFLFAQFVLILWSVDFWPEWPKLGFDLRITLRAMLMLGIFGTAYQVVMLRMYPIFLDQWVISRARRPQSTTRRPLTVNLAAVPWRCGEGTPSLESMLPEGATIQFNPRGDTNGYFCGLYANRQVVAFDEGCVATFGGARADCVGLISRILPIFETPALQPPIDLRPLTYSFFRTRIRSGPTGAVGSGRCSRW